MATQGLVLEKVTEVLVVNVCVLVVMDTVTVVVAVVAVLVGGTWEKFQARNSEV